jgi:O-antigen ligase
LSALTPLFLTTVYYTLTRSVWTGVVLGLLVVLMMTLHGRLRLVVVSSLLATTLLGSVAARKALVDMKRADERGAKREGSLVSAEERLAFAYVSWKMFRDHPLFGVGFGHFLFESPAYLGDTKTDLPLGAIRGLMCHNTFLSLLTETGPLGLCLFVALLAAWGRRAWQLSRAHGAPDWVRSQAALLLASLAVYASNYFSHEISYIQRDNCLIFLLAGMTAGIPYARTRPEPSSLALHTGNELPTATRASSVLPKTGTGCKSRREPPICCPMAGESAPDAAEKQAFREKRADLIIS